MVRKRCLGGINSVLQITDRVDIIQKGMRVRSALTLFLGGTPGRRWSATLRQILSVGMMKAPVGITDVGPGTIILSRFGGNIPRRDQTNKGSKFVCNECMMDFFGFKEFRGIVLRDVVTNDGWVLGHDFVYRCLESEAILIRFEKITLFESKLINVTMRKID